MIASVKLTNISNEMKAYEINFLNGQYFRVLNYGITITDWGFTEEESLILKYSNDNLYIENKSYLGCIIGPYAGRIKNASFVLDEKPIMLDKNDGNHCLHSGNLGLSRVYWDVEYTIDHDKVIFIFTYDWKEDNISINYPGQGLYKVILSVHESKEITLEYETDLIDETYISLTHHMYFKTYNFQDRLFINNRGYLQLDGEKIPTGLVKNDFGQGEMPLRAWFNKIDPDNGLDHPFILDSNKFIDIEKSHAIYTGPKYQVKVSTSCPYMVVYSGAYLDKAFSGIAFEPQECPDGPNHSNFSVKSTLKKRYKSKTTYRIREIQ